MEGIISTITSRMWRLWDNIEPMVRFEFIYRHNYVRYISYPIGLLIITSCFLYGQWPNSHDMVVDTVGDKFFSYMMVIFIMLTTSIGCFHAALSISSEKEKKTLTILRMSGMSSFDIIAGKSATSFLFAIFIIFPHLPLVLACPFLGGITFSKVFGGIAILMVMTLFYTTSGVFVSMLAKKNYISIALAIFMLFSVHFGGYFMDYICFSEYDNYGYARSTDDAIFYTLSPMEIWQNYLWEQTNSRRFYPTHKIPSLTVAGMEFPAFIIAAIFYLASTFLICGAGTGYMERYLKWRED